MNNIKKRFGTINMTKEFEETVLNDANQMNGLYEEIDSLKNIIKEKDIEIKLLNDKIYMLNEIINKNEINKKNNDFDNHSDSESSSENIINYLNTPDNEEIIVEQNFESNKDDSFYWEEYKKYIYIYYNDFETYYNKYYTYYDNIDTNYDTDMSEKNNANKRTPKVRRQRNKELPILERFIAIPYDTCDIKNSEILQYVSSEDSYNIKYQYIIADKINKKIEEMTIDEVIDFKIKYDKRSNSKTTRIELKHKIERCEYLYNKYKENLSKFKISLSDLSIMSSEEWEEWKIAFDILYNEIFNINKPVPCTHKYKGGRVCNKPDCKIKSHK
jgi:hypothetical protein